MGEVLLTEEVTVLFRFYDTGPLCRVITESPSDACIRLRLMPHLLQEGEDAINGEEWLKRARRRLAEFPGYRLATAMLGKRLITSNLLDELIPAWRQYCPIFPSPVREGSDGAGTVLSLRHREQWQEVHRIVNCPYWDTEERAVMAILVLPED